jgi:hypothetical protein
MRRQRPVFQQSRQLVPDSNRWAQPTEEAMGVTNKDPAQNPTNPADPPDPADPADGHYTADLWQPPWWLLVFAPFCWLLVGALILNARGWQIALAAALLLAPIGMPIPVILRWLKTHPRLAGLYTAPLTFAVTVLLTSLPLWLCVATTIAITLLALVITTIHAFSRAE